MTRVTKYSACIECLMVPMSSILILLHALDFLVLVAQLVLKYQNR